MVFIQSRTIIIHQNKQFVVTTDAIRSSPLRNAVRHTESYVTMICLIPNIGSTSFKYRVLKMPEETALANGRVERIGQPGGDCPDYPSAIRKCIDDVVGPGKALKSLSEIEAVGFRSEERRVGKECRSRGS